jgi:mannose-1-phosphate guanylyltransferase/mannose-6-phosphate isomerase
MNCALVLSGGAGVRLWPMSSPERPKQFLKLFGARSLFQMTIARLQSAAIDRIVLVAQQEHEPLIRRQLAEIGAPDCTLLLEPARRDSAPAIAAGTAHVLRTEGPDAAIVALPCDHLIPSAADFAGAVTRGIALAREGYIATFGIRPTAPATEFGYIRHGMPIPGVAGSFRVMTFHEKPNAERAATYFANGHYDWNSGIFAFTAGTLAEEAKWHMPAVWQAAVEAEQNGKNTGTVRMLNAEAFCRAPRISLDYALLEKSARVGVIPVDFAWSDVGNWRAVRGAQPQDEHGNAVVGDAALSEAEGNLVVGEGMRVAVIGVQGLAIVATPTGVLVVPLDRAAEIKALIESRPAAAE